MPCTTLKMRVCCGGGHTGSTPWMGEGGTPAARRQATGVVALPGKLTPLRQLRVASSKLCGMTRELAGLRSVGLWNSHSGIVVDAAGLASAASFEVTTVLLPTRT